MNIAHAACPVMVWQCVVHARRFASISMSRGATSEKQTAPVPAASHRFKRANHFPSENRSGSLTAMMNSYDTQPGDIFHGGDKLPQHRLDLLELSCQRRAL